MTLSKQLLIFKTRFSKKKKKQLFTQNIHKQAHEKSLNPE